LHFPKDFFYEKKDYEIVYKLLEKYSLMSEAEFEKAKNIENYFQD
jgi:hypothetical protein